MKVVPIMSKGCDHILEELKGKVFFAVSIVNEDYFTHLPDFLTPSQIVFGAEVLKRIVMEASKLDEQHIND